MGRRARRTSSRFLLGLGLGFGIGVLIAPCTAVRLRRRVLRRVQQQATTVRDAGEALETLFEEVPPPAAVSDDETAAAQEKQLLNLASREELLALHGIGPATADRIMNHRPYSSLDDLRERRVVSRAVCEELRKELARRKAQEGS